MIKRIGERVCTPFCNIPLNYKVIESDIDGGATMMVFDPFEANEDPSFGGRYGWQSHPNSSTKRLHIVVVKTREGKYHVQIKYYVFEPSKQWKCIHEHSLNNYDSYEEIYEVVNFFGRMMYYD